MHVGHSIHCLELSKVESCLLLSLEIITPDKVTLI